ncbi:MAG: formylglycine-generating enzyme family protein [Synechococcales cyanobacterium T60_A2020_003]|nr:formylglycine-generating enzyme family protein [Synechococcales cyanobacterium T60_A2020_003]
MGERSKIEFDVVTVDFYGHPLEKLRCTASSWSDVISEGVVIRCVDIPAGSFQMGSPATEEGCHPSQRPQHSVAIAPFRMSQTPITQAQWFAVASLPRVSQDLPPQPSCFSGDHHPVEQVSWEEAMEFCVRLSAHTQRSYRLPTEAEWEYACRAHTQTPFHFGHTITTELANYSGVNWEYEGKLCNKGFYGKGPTGCDRRQTMEVGSFGVANGFGLYDMHGQVKEWCLDVWYPDYTDAPTDGSARISHLASSPRVLRGGSWNSGPRACRSAYRTKLDPNSRLYDVGFRVVCD